MILISYLTLLMTTALFDQPNTDIKTYTVKRIQNELLVTGEGDSPLWATAVELSDFIYPWENEEPPVTSFKALHNSDWLYCLFRVKDANINLFVDKNAKSEVASSDRVEIFFKIDDLLSPYYGLEMDPLGRVMDYKAEYYRKFDSGWSWPAGEMVIKTDLRKDSYTVELAFSKKSLNALGLVKTKRLLVGLYRGNCIALKGKEATLKWISWVKPDSPTPDFHIPSSFGVFILED